MHKMTRRLSPFSMLAMLAMGGCSSAADDLLLDASDALQECDMRTAEARFAEAWRLEPERHEAALGFALTNTILLPEDPAITQLLTDLGFTRGFDMEALVFGADSIFARAGRGETCDDIALHYQANIRYPAFCDSTARPASLIHSELLASDGLDTLLAIDARLADLARAYETAAATMTEPARFEGGCGIGEVAIQKPELYLLAAALQAVRGGIDLARTYDWELSVRGLLATDSAGMQELVEALNAHLGRVVAPGAPVPARAKLLEALALADSAIAEATTIDDAVDGALVQWAEVPAVNLDDASRLVSFARAALDGAQPVPEVSPTLTVDASSIFTQPIDLTDQGQPLFVFLEDELDPRISIAEDVLSAALQDVFDPMPWTDTLSFSSQLKDRWRDLPYQRILVPAEHHQIALDCAGIVSCRIPTSN